MSGIEGVRRVRSARPEIQILMLTVHGDDADVFEAICGGACGYLLKDTSRERLLAAIRELREVDDPVFL
jgi:DNA-binding NarL/FixJ family response regulator